MEKSLEENMQDKDGNIQATPHKQNQGLSTDISKNPGDDDNPDDC